MKKLFLVAVLGLVGCASNNSSETMSGFNSGGKSTSVGQGKSNKAIPSGWVLDSTRENIFYKKSGNSIELIYNDCRMYNVGRPTEQWDCIEGNPYMLFRSMHGMEHTDRDMSSLKLEGDKIMAFGLQIGQFEHKHFDDDKGIMEYGVVCAEKFRSVCSLEIAKTYAGERAVFTLMKKSSLDENNIVLAPGWEFHREGNKLTLKDELTNRGSGSKLLGASNRDAGSFSFKDLELTIDGDGVFFGNVELFKYRNGQIIYKRPLSGGVDHIATGFKVDSDRYGYLTMERQDYLEFKEYACTYPRACY